MPPFSAVNGTYGREFWRIRASAQGADDTTTVLEQRWNDDYLHVASGNTEFGIVSKSADWLHGMWDAGKVAFICGVLNNPSRDHELAIRTMEMGNRAADKFTFGSGWGGRLAQAANRNVIALTTSPRRFSFAPNPNALSDLSLVDDRKVIPADGTGKKWLTLAEATPGTDYYGFNDKLKRRA